MKDHKYDIKRILNGSGSAIDDINLYIQEETRSNDKKWCWLLVVVAITYCIFAYTNKITTEDKINAAKPIVDSMKQKYQLRLDEITDSLFSYSYIQNSKH